MPYLNYISDYIILFAELKRWMFCEQFLLKNEH